MSRILRIMTDADSQSLSRLMPRNVRSRPDNINISTYDVTRTLVRVTGDVRPVGSRT